MPTVKPWTPASPRLLPVVIFRLVAQHPRLLTDFRDTSLLAARLAEMRSQLPGINVVALIHHEPYMLYADIPSVLDNCRCALEHTPHNPVRSRLACLGSSPHHTPVRRG